MTCQPHDTEFLLFFCPWYNKYKKGTFPYVHPLFYRICYNYYDNFDPIIKVVILKDNKYNFTD
jgi:hypothetical protein